MTMQFYASYPVARHGRNAGPASAGMVARLRRNPHTYASWLNQVEIWFGQITRKAIRRGSFNSVADLKAQIQRYTQHWNEHPQPFVWTATAESILAKIERLCKVIYGTQH